MCTVLFACADEPSASLIGDDARRLPMALVIEEAAAPTLELIVPDSEYVYGWPVEFGPSPVAVGFLSVSATPEGECMVALPAEVAQALSEWNAAFRMWRARDYDTPGYALDCSASGTPLPFAFAGDWNGDGIADVVVHGYDDQRNALVAVMSVAAEPGLYTVAVIHGYDLPPTPAAGEARWPATSVLIKKPRRTQPCTDDTPPLDLAGDNFGISWDEKPSETHYYELGQWKKTYEGC